MKLTGSGPPSSQKPATNKQTKQKQTNKEKTNPPNIFVAGSLTSQELGLELSLSEASAVL